MSQSYTEEVNAARQIVRSNLVKETMMAGKFAASYGLRLAFSTEMPLIIKRSGYQACLMNLEHMAIGMETMKDVSVSCMNVGITPCVVVPTCASEWISRCLDSAAQVIIIPHVDNAEMAQAAVNAGKFPPMGKRSVTMVTAITQYSSNFGYKAIAEVVNDSVMIMPMIESPEGLQNAEAIAATEGIDCLFIGCADLCMELGIPQQYESDTFNKAVETVAKACEKASVNGRKVFVGLGGLEPRPDLIEKFALKYPAVRFAMAGRDIATLMGGMANQAKVFNAISEKL